MRSFDLTECQALHEGLWCEFKVPSSLLAESKKAQRILLATFPQELRLVVFQDLDPLDLVSLLLTCKAFLHFFFDVKSVQIPSRPLHSFTRFYAGQCPATIELLRMLPPRIDSERPHQDSDESFAICRDCYLYRSTAMVDWEGKINGYLALPPYDAQELNCDDAVVRWCRGGENRRRCPECWILTTRASRSLLRNPDADRRPFNSGPCRQGASIANRRPNDDFSDLVQDLKDVAAFFSRYIILLSLRALFYDSQADVASAKLWIMSLKTLGKPPQQHGPTAHEKYMKRLLLPFDDDDRLSAQDISS